ncbi:MAG: YcaQ family DNA glycosylase [Acidobacteria bacterium]|nr:YcaQ family DNA glycosylase [Acidobacteriota bacterium]
MTTRQARRLALARAGLLKPSWTGLPSRAAGRGKRARDAALAVVERFGYLQLDTVSIAGARSHTIVLLSRLEGIDPTLGEELLRHGEPLFEYWGHEASWIPMALYPAFEFRRQEFEHHPWWGDLVGEHPEVADRLRRRIRDEGALKSADMEGSSGNGWWDLKLAKKVATALWSSGELAIRERVNFQRAYDLAERVIPEEVRERPLDEERGLETLLLKALDGHGWATTGTLATTWRLRNRRAQIDAALRRLEEAGQILPCALENADGAPVAGKGTTGKATTGWIRPDDLELAARLDTVRPRRDQGVLLSPFDPVLWERQRVQRLFGFDQVLEIFKPAPQRVYGYYCLPVLAGEELLARFDLKAERAQGLLRVLSCRFESTGAPHAATARETEAARTALERYATALGLETVGWHPT